MQKTRIIITGAKGRMGRAVNQCADRMPEIEVVGRIDLGDDLATVIADCDVVIDFSFQDATAGIARLCASRGKALVTGATGHSEEERERVLAHAGKVPIVWASNFSTGVNALFWLTAKAVEILGPGFDLEVVEMHHRMKKDAPSGTAASLARILAEGRKARLEEVVRHGRQGIVGERSSSEIGVHSLRGGDVVGDHTVVFAAPGERVELSHKASSRDTFANGSLRAALWVVGQPPGLYDMGDVLGLK